MAESISLQKAICRRGSRILYGGVGKAGVLMGWDRGRRLGLLLVFFCDKINQLVRDTGCLQIVTQLQKLLNNCSKLFFVVRFYKSKSGVFGFIFLSINFSKSKEYQEVFKMF